MAPANGMAGYVNQRNGDVTTDLADLKRPVPTPGAKDERKQKSKQNAVPRERSQPNRQARHQDNASMKSNNSSTDNLSTTASTSRQKAGRDQRLETRSKAYDRHGANGDQPPAMFGGTDYDEDADNDQDLPEDPLVNKEGNFQKMLAQSRGANGSPTIAQIHIKGDSYPPTSAGVPSVTDRHDRGEIRASGGIQNLPTHAAERGIYNARPQRQQLQPVASRHQLPTAPHVQGQPAPSHQPQDIRPLDSEPASDYEVQGFSFGRAPTIKKEVAVHPSHAQRQTMNSRPLTAEVKSDATRPHREVNKQAVPRESHAAANNHLAPTERHAYQHERHPRVAEIQSYHDHHGASSGQALMPDQAPASDALTEEDPSEQLEQQNFNEDPLDYGPEELYKKDYSSLKAEPFDHSPNAHPFVVSGLSESAVLTDKLTHLTGAEPKTQAEFFASLNIDEWEESGDWFLDRFGETIKKLKDVRREKRKAARAFEDEIEARETTVHKKRALTHAAMIEMKTSGAAVLQGTPGKKK